MEIGVNIRPSEVQSLLIYSVVKEYKNIINNKCMIAEKYIEECKNNFKVALEHFDMSREYFLESHDEYTADEENPDDTDASIRADQTRDYMKLIKKDF